MRCVYSVVVTDEVADHLVCDDKDLCQLAFERNSLAKLANLVRSITPNEASPGWDEDEPESTSRLREVRPCPS